MENTTLFTEVILVNTPPTYGELKWVDNIEWMLEGNLEFDSIQIINDVELGGVYDKLRIFDLCRDRKKQYIYFDLDLIIKDNISHLLRKILHYYMHGGETHFILLLIVLS